MLTVRRGGSLALLDETPDGAPLSIEIGPFALSPVGVTTVRDALIDEWASALAWVMRAEWTTPFWVGDLVNYGQSKYGEKYTAILEETEFAKHTIENAAYVARSIPCERRRLNLPFSHHAEVAPLPPDQQEAWLDQCQAEDLTRDQLRARLRAAKGVPARLRLVVTCQSQDEQMQLAEELRGRGLVVAVDEA